MGKGDSDLNKLASKYGIDSDFFDEEKITYEELPVAISLKKEESVNASPDN